MARTEFREFLRHERLDVTIVQNWVEAGWLAPQPPGDDDGFSEVDLARGQLICDLKRMGVNDDAMPIILDLIDQVHGLRRVLRNALAAFDAQSREATEKGET
jgi:chaperone modulatory protein CbpM